MCVYLSKTEDSCSNAMKQALTESIEKRQNNFDQMRAIALAYASNRECSVQEAVYHCLPELWLRNVFPRVIYANNNLPKKRFKMLRLKEEISCLPDDSKDIFKKNMLDRYMDRPDESFLNGRYNSMNLICYAEFLRYYYLAAKPQDNDWQPEELSDDLLENNFSNEIHPSVIALMTCNDKLKCRKVPSVLRLFTSNKD